LCWAPSDLSACRLALTIQGCCRHCRAVSRFVGFTCPAKGASRKQRLGASCVRAGLRPRLCAVTRSLRHTAQIQISIAAISADCMDVCIMYVCMHTYIHTYMYIHIHIQIHIQIHAISRLSCKDQTPTLFSAADNAALHHTSAAAMHHTQAQPPAAGETQPVQPDTQQRARCHAQEANHEHPAHKIFGVVRDAVPVWRRKRVVATTDLPEERDGVFAVEGRETAEHDVQHHADAPHVNLWPVTVGATEARVQHLRRYIPGRAAHCAHGCPLPPGPRPSQPASDPLSRHHLHVNLCRPPSLSPSRGRALRTCFGRFFTHTACVHMHPQPAYMHAHAHSASDGLGCRVDVFRSWLVF